MSQICLLSERLFHDVVGLARAQNLPILALPGRTSDSSADSTTLVPLDNLPLWWSKTFLFPSIRYLKDLSELIKQIRSDRKVAISASTRKVRPNTVRLGDMDSSQRFVSQRSYSGDNNMSPWSPNRPGTPNNHSGGIKERLVDSFFHQHKDLQQICDMVVDRAIRNFSSTASQACIQLFRSRATSFQEYFNRTPSMTLDEYMKLLKAVEVNANEDATTLMNNDFDRIIKGALQLLAPPETNPMVVEVATSLAINHATQKAEKTLRSIISEEKKKLLDEFVRKEKKFKSGVSLSSTKKKGHDIAPKKRNLESDGLEFQSITKLTASLRALHELDASFGGNLERLKREKANVIIHLQQYFIGCETPQACVELEVQVLSMLREFFSNPSAKSLCSLRAAIEVGDVLSLLGKLGYANLLEEKLESLLCDASNMLTLMDRVNYDENMERRANPLSHETIGHFLFLLVEGSLVSYQALETALIHSVKVNDDAKIVSRIVLHKFSSSRTGMITGDMANLTDGLVIMIRLQRMLRRMNESEDKNQQSPQIAKILFNAYG